MVSDQQRLHCDNDHIARGGMCIYCISYVCSSSQKKCNAECGRELSVRELCESHRRSAERGYAVFESVPEIHARSILRQKRKPDAGTEGEYIIGNNDRRGREAERLLDLSWTP